MMQLEWLGQLTCPPGTFRESQSGLCLPIPPGVNPADLPGIVNPTPPPPVIVQSGPTDEEKRRQMLLIAGGVVLAGLIAYAVLR